MSKYLDKEAYWYVGFSTRYGYLGNPNATFKVACISAISHDKLSVGSICTFGNASRQDTKEKVNWMMKQRIEELKKSYPAKDIKIRKHFGWIVSVGLDVIKA